MGRELRMIAMIVVVAAVAAGTGCGLLRRSWKAGQPSEEGLVDDMRHGRRPMGQVIVVNGASGFVLVRSPLAVLAPEGSTLIVKAQGNAETTGTLKVSPERKRHMGHMVAADIVEGTPKVGEVVYFQTGERILSTVPPPDGTPGSGGGGSAGTGLVGSGLTGQQAMGAQAMGAEEGSGPLPPLGEPSGPREYIPDFHGLEPLPEGGQLPEPPPEPAEPAPLATDPIP